MPIQDKTPKETRTIFKNHTHDNHLRKQHERHPLVVRVEGEFVVGLRGPNTRMGHLDPHLLPVQPVHRESAHDEAVVVHDVFVRIRVDVSQTLDLLPCGRNVFRGYRDSPRSSPLFFFFYILYCIIYLLFV